MTNTNTFEIEKIQNNARILSLKIYELQSKNEFIYNTKLVDFLAGTLTPKEISHSLDKLIDEGKLKAEWRIDKKLGFYRSIFLTSLTFDNITTYLNKEET